MLPQKGFKVEVKGIKQLRKRLDSQNLLYTPLRAYFNDTGKVIKKKAKQNTPDFTGKLKSQIKYKKVADKGRLPGGIKVYVTTSYAPYVHGYMDRNYKYKGLKFPKDKDKFSRTKPHWPPLQALAPWANAKGIPVFLVAKAISEKGTAIVPFLKMGYEQSEKQRLMLLKTTTLKVEKKWKQSRALVK